MNRFTFSAFFLASALAGGFQNTSGQAINATTQTTSPRVAASRNAPTTAAKPVPAARPAPKGAPRQTGINPQRVNPNMPRTIAQPPANVQRTYSPQVQTSNPAFTAVNVPQSGAVQQPMTVDPAARQT